MNKENMKQNFAFIAIGQAGGNIGGEFEKRGFSVLYLNTSQEDLDVTKGVHKYHIAGGRGSSKDRKKAKHAVNNDFDSIMREIDTNISDKISILYIVFATGGGTGSGASPMLADLLIGEFDERFESEVEDNPMAIRKRVGLIPILPSSNDSIKAHLNSYECFREINEIEGLASCFILDNDKKDKMSINGEFADAFTSFITIPERHRDNKGNIDTSEIYKPLSTSGASIIVSANEESNILDKFDKNIYAPLEDDKIIKYISVSLAGKITLEDIKKKVGIPFDEFHTFNKNKTICCLSGLSFPETRLNEIYEITKENEEIIKRSLSSRKMNLIDDEIEIIDESDKIVSRKSRDKETNKSNKKQTSSRRDIFSKYL